MRIWSVIAFALLASVASAQTSADIPALRQAAERGDAQSQYALGLAYEFGKGVVVDPVQAAQWYRKAAEQGYAGAQFNLGVAFANGTGLPKDLAQAAQWYRKAANNGDVAAQFNLGLMYFRGEPLLEDFTEAYKWMTIAASRATAEEKTQVSEGHALVAARLTPAQAAEAETRAREWMEAFEKRPAARAALVPPLAAAPPPPAAAPPPPAARPSPAPRPSPAAPIRVGPNVPPPTKIKDVDPEYPATARSARVQGVVVIEATVGTDGKVRDARIVRSIPLLDAAALAAVGKWEFAPTLLNGVPVAVITLLPVAFTLR